MPGQPHARTPIRIPGAWETVGACQQNTETTKIRNALSGHFTATSTRHPTPLPPGYCELKAKNRNAVREYIKNGFAIDEVDYTAALAEIDKDDLPDLIGLSLRTLARRKAEGKRLTREESDRLYRLQRIISAALRLFEGNVASMRRWLKTSLPALDGENPLQYSDTEPGAQMVLDIIARAEHGVFS